MFIGGFSGGGVGPPGPPGIWVNDPAFVQPALAGTVNTRWSQTYLQPAIGMVLASAAGVYEVTAELGGGVYEVMCLEIRGVPQGGNVVAGTVFGQAGT